MSKKVFDKYYTSFELAEYCYKKAVEVIGKENITEIIEPSAGKGVFLDVDKNIIGYDIEPEDDRIIKQDFLELVLPYKKGRLIIGNPPYGRCLNLGQKFYHKSVLLGDYIAFILPISQYMNTSTLYEFDLIYSEDLGIKMYSDVELHCVFNIYKRPKDDILNNKEIIKLKDIKIFRQDRKDYLSLDYDIRMCYWGFYAGKVLEEDEYNEHYAGEYKLQINIDDEDKKKEIIEFLKNYDWKEDSKGIAMKRLKQFQILRVLRDNFEFLK